MLVKEFCINNEHGLHARPASLFCDLASKFKSDIKVFRENNSDYEADGKSVISVLMLEVYPGVKITIQIDGSDEEEAMQALTDLIDRNFDE